MVNAVEKTSRGTQGGIGFNLAAIMLVIGMGGVGFAYLVDGATRAAQIEAHRADPTPVSRTLGGRELHIPRNWLRHDEQTVEGFVRQVELSFELPLGTRKKPATVQVTLVPRSRVRPSAALLDGVYLHQFLPQQLTGPEGLIGKPLRAAEGYEDETVWYDAVSANPFVAKCSRAIAAEADARCVRTVYLGPGLAAIYDFPESALANWRQLDAELTPKLETIRAL